MVFKTHNVSPWHIIARTGFWVSIISYVGFWLMDVIRPGFVARTFSVHWFLWAAIGFGAWWLSYHPEARERPWRDYFIAIFVGLLLAVISWRIGVGFEAYRFLMTVVAFLVPLPITHVIRTME